MRWTNIKDQPLGPKDLGWQTLPNRRWMISVQRQTTCVFLMKTGDNCALYTETLSVYGDVQVEQNLGYPISRNSWTQTVIEKLEV